MSKTLLEARNCVRAFLGDGPPTPEALARLMEYFYVHEFHPLKEDLSEVRDQMTTLTETIVDWKASLRTLIWICAIIGGTISAVGTVLGILVTLYSLGILT